MLADVIKNYPFRQRLHAIINGYRLPAVPVRISQGVYLTTNQSEAHRFLHDTWCIQEATLVYNGYCCRHTDVTAELSFLNKHDKLFIVILWSYPVGADVLSMLKNRSLVIGNATEARTVPWEFMGRNGISTLLYAYEVYRLGT